MSVGRRRVYPPSCSGEPVMARASMDLSRVSTTRHELGLGHPEADFALSRVVVYPIAPPPVPVGRQAGKNCALHRIGSPSRALSGRQPSAELFSWLDAPLG